MTEPNEAMKAMARRIAATELRNHNDWADLYRDAVLRGDYDGSDGVRCALAAIIETQRADAELADSVIQDARNGDIESDLRAIAYVMAQRFEAGNHYGKDESHD